ncbi:hypothetical protein GCM10010435_15990 [Winogradskya consettensis]|uniref:Uncharacterized protein n=1 Tax=Winogradskya consettensis TaxID=113560 RepID=A0A919VKE9_9ACTN|nr:hypothetical protein [Actinoplanes consettensis]GIM69419.1 hypothetical protein Aco04nite_15260 [Actinoplanes consettensis]
MLLVTTLMVLLAVAAVAGLLRLRRARTTTGRHPDDLGEAAVTMPVVPLPPLPTVAAAAGVGTLPEPVVVEATSVPMAVSPERVISSPARRSARNSASSRFAQSTPRRTVPASRP